MAQATRSPGTISVTPGPTSSTRPAPSVPGVNGRPIGWALDLLEHHHVGLALLVHADSSHRVLLRSLTDARKPTLGRTFRARSWDRARSRRVRRTRRGARARRTGNPGPVST